ncbi:MAG: 4-hydroxy-3-methylbut-2-enyl diphosphate reductase [Gemmatimonadota bacterium]|nr:MAG: 4-hydroxy-3-methylbut-2-enyl diphosphate reductase [Gemmatimonadota bacterium]
MRVLVAENSGFCFGVKRAINMAFEAVENDKGPAYTLGPIIHNPQMVAKMKKSGIRVVDDISELWRETLIIRSHGVSPLVLQEAKRRELRVVDATCPFVRKSQMYAQSLLKEGYQVAIVGDPDHPEVEGLLGYTKDTALVLSEESHLNRLELGHRIGVIAQTTISLDHFQNIVDRLKTKTRELKVYNTICDSVVTRQRSTAELAKKADAMVVIGGKNSANTARLAHLCRDLCRTTYHVETAEEVQADWFHRIDVVGVTAGTSTPDWIIKEILDRIHEIQDICYDGETIETLLPSR